MSEEYTGSSPIPLNETEYLYSKHYRVGYLAAMNSPEVRQLAKQRDQLLEALRKVISEHAGVERGMEVPDCDACWDGTKLLASQSEQQGAPWKERAQKFVADTQAQASQLAYEHQQAEEERSYQED